MTLSALGIFSAAGAGGVVDDYELIETLVSNGSIGTIQFSSIPQNYKHLQVRYTAKNTSSETSFGIQMNAIGTSSYFAHALIGSSTSVSSTNTGSVFSMHLINGMASSTTTGRMAAGVIDILDYASSTKNTTIRALYGQDSTNQNITLRSGLLNNTAAINIVSFVAFANNFANTTRFSLYGIKG
jgi:hypothetical protein